MFQFIAQEFVSACSCVPCIAMCMFMSWLQYMLMLHCFILKYPDCPTNSIQCPNTTICVNNTAACDGNMDCPNGEDEAVSACGKSSTKYFGYSCI